MLNTIKKTTAAFDAFADAIDIAVEAMLKNAEAIAKTMSAQDFMLDPKFTEFCYENGIYIDLY